MQHYHWTVSHTVVCTNYNRLVQFRQCVKLVTTLGWCVFFKLNCRLFSIKITPLLVAITTKISSFEQLNGMGKLLRSQGMFSAKFAMFGIQRHSWSSTIFHMWFFSQCTTVVWGSIGDYLIGVCRLKPMFGAHNCAQNLWCCDR